MMLFSQLKDATFPHTIHTLHPSSHYQLLRITLFTPFVR
jgi:hypothetical protein